MFELGRARTGNPSFSIWSRKITFFHRMNDLIYTVIREKERI